MGKKVAVIGGGYGGIAALRRLSECPAVTDIVGFERYGEVGGLWVYTDRTGTDEDGLPVHSCAYKDLISNGPKINQCFPDFPFAKPQPSFMLHTEVKDYLDAYADHFDLKRFIKFKTLVSRVEPLSPGSRDTRWAVTYCSPGKPETSTTEKFDAVIVCNGHSWLPYEPDIEGRSTFKGIFIHSRDFRVTDPFKDKTVVLFGAGITALDLAPILGPVAKKIILSAGRDGLQFVIPDNACRKPPIRHVTETSVVFDNGEEERVDAIILCTGYRYNFPFLTEACGVVLQNEDRRVTPLYKHIVNTTHPSLMFVGLVDHGATVALMDVQSMFVTKVLDGTVKLPNKSEMDEDTEKELEARSHGTDYLRKRHNFHKLAMLQKGYCDDLAAIADIPTMPMYRAKLFEYMLTEAVAKQTLTYKEDQYEVSGDTFVRIPAHSLQ